MIYVRIHYGLGNQMYQYALARSLSLILNTPFRLDLSFFQRQAKTDNTRDYGLHAFNIVEDIASNEELRKYIQPTFLRRRLNQIERLLLPSYRRGYVTEDSRQFDANLFRVKKDCYLAGYWHHERYFKRFEDVIRRDFTFKDLPDRRNLLVLENIDQTNSVAIHIRRGDYLTDPHAIKNFEQCSLDYYYSAVDYIKRCVKNPHFFVFSDDSEWVSENFILQHPTTYIDDHNIKMPYEDMRLMSHSNHFIIANSSFSWWGAWLGSRPGKIVIGPKKWFRKEEHLYPKGWIGI